MAYDVVIRNGRVVDGSGLGSFRGDVGIIDGRIAAIGRIKERGATDIDAEGHAVTPGFIDVHTHFDAQVFWDQLGTNSCWHGVTTVVMGHCGFTLAPAAPEERMLVVRNLERAEDISGAAMAAGIDWSWTTFAQYLDAVDRQPKGLNYAANVGHSALRTHAMGERAFEEEATDDDLKAMAAELEDSLRAGAFGFTSSRTRHHRTSDDRPVASRLAAWSEVVHLVEVLGDLGVGILQMVADPAGPGEVDTNDLLRELAVATGVTAVTGASTQRGLDLLESTIAAGGRMVGLIHPRGIGTMSSFRTQLPFDRLPVWREVRARPVDEQRHALQDPDLVGRLVQAANEAQYAEALGGEARPPQYDRLRVIDRPTPPNPSVAEMAAARGIDPVELMIQLSLETDMSQFFFQGLMPFDYEDTKRCMRHPYTVMGFSDSGAHVSQMSDASIQTHLLAHWVRERQDFTLEEAVQMLSLAPARAWGFHDRGLLREGMVADINVFDPDRVGPAMPIVANDLPAGEKRITQRSVGFLATLVNGEVLIADGEPTGARPGQLIRGPLATRGK